MSTGMTAPRRPQAGAADLQRYIRASQDLQATRSELEELEMSEAVGLFQKQRARGARDERGGRAVPETARSPAQAAAEGAGLLQADVHRRRHTGHRLGVPA